MNSPDSSPKLSVWPFAVAYVALAGAALVIANGSARPFSPTVILSIVGCVIAGALVMVVPVIAHFERQKNDALDERQRALEALSRTVASSAEQISIAAGGLHEISELAQKNVRSAEQLPHKLQEKIAAFQAQLTQAADTDKEELERELLALRTSESERLEAVSQRIAKSSAEWAKLEASTQQHLTAATDALAKLHRATADAIGKAQAAAEQALTQARTEAARSLGETSGAATRAVDSAKTAAVAELESKTAAAIAAAADLTTRLEAASRALDEKLSRLATAPLPPSDSSAISETPTAAASPDNPPASPEPLATSPASPPKRPRKSRRDEPSADTPAPASEPAPSSPAEPSSPAAAPANSTPEPELESAPAPAAEEPPPVPVENIAEITPVAPETAEPFSNRLEKPAAPTAAETAPPPPAVPPAAAPASEPAAAEPKPPRKRMPRKPEPDPADAEPSLGLDLDDPASRAAAAGVLERVLSSDGATRLLVTAYIGIGNRLFIRGDGPGLSWDKGIPLQFVSIGKWRWETNDASGPVQFKLYKNDDLECAALGQQTLEPGHQQELTAAF